MTKNEFLGQLEAGLSALPKSERDERIGFYAEMIDDRLEEGLTEQEAVAAVGGIGEVIARELAEARSIKQENEEAATKRTKRGWTAVALSAGFPLWISLLAVAFALLVTVYMAVWSVTVSCWAVGVSLGACAIAGTLGGIPLCFTHGVWTGLAVFGVGIFSAGAAVFALYGCVKLTVLIAKLTKAISLWCTRQLSRIFKGGKK